MRIYTWGRADGTENITVICIALMHRFMISKLKFSLSSPVSSSGQWISIFNQFYMAEK